MTNEPLLDIKDARWQPFWFPTKAKITFMQGSLAIYILCKSDEASYNIFSFRRYD